MINQNEIFEMIVWISKDTRCLNCSPSKGLWIQIIVFNHLHFLGHQVKHKSQGSCQSHHQLLLCRNHRKTKGRKKHWRKRDQNQPLQLKTQRQLPQALRYVIHMCICKDYNYGLFLGSAVINYFTPPWICQWVFESDQWVLRVRQQGRNVCVSYEENLGYFNSWAPKLTNVHLYRQHKSSMN